MPQHYGITSTYGVTLPSGAIAQDASSTETVEVSEVVGTDGEYAKADPLHTKKVDVTINGVGSAGRDDVVSGVIVTPATMSTIKADQTEVNKGRSTFAINAASMVAFDDSVGDIDLDATGDPDEDTLTLVSVDYTLAESVKVGTSANDIMITDKDGKPAARALNKLKNDFDVSGKGDIPAGLALGTGNVAIAGLTGGKIIVLQKKANQKMDEWNGWGVTGNHYPAAA